MSLPNLESLIVIVKPNSIYAEEVFTYPENAARCWTQNVLQCWTENWTENVLITHADTEGLITRRSSKAAAATWATSAAHLQLNLTFRPKNLLKGFIFGTDENTCDVLLQRSRATGISGNHFSIQIDWDTGNPILSCLSERGISLKDERTGEYVRTLYRDGGETVLPGATLLVEVIDRFELTISCPDRGRLQPVYDRNLEDYYRNYKDAVPDVSTMLLDRPDMTPFILHRCTGLNGGEYYTTQKMATGDTEYDSKVFLYYAKSKSAAGEIGRIASPEPKPISRTRGKQPEGRLTQPDTTRLQSNVAGFDTVKESFLENAKSQIYVVKHFRDKQGDWDETSWIARRLNLLKHLNILRVIDIIVMDSAFMVVNENFHHMTLDSIQRHAAPLSSEESGFVMGQVFEGLNYLHEQRWAHGNVDPCSILVLSRDSLFIKLADTALSGMAGLGKPEGYHDFYASQKIIPGLDQYPGDIWSAGVVGLHLVHGSLPGRTQYTSSSQSRYVAQLETYLKSLTRKQSSNDALRFLTRVMKYKPPDRPTAKELLEDSWIQDTRHYKALQLPVSRPTTPQASRHPSAGPSNTFSRQSSAGPLKSMNRGEDAPRSRPTSVGPSSNLSRQSSTDPTFRAQSHPYPGDDFNDFDSKHGTTVSRSSRITANPLAQMGRTSIEYESDDNASPPDRERSSRSQSHSNGGGRSLTIGSQHGETASQSSDFTANPLAREPRTPTPYYSDDHSGRLDPLRTQPRSSGGRSPAIGSKHGSIISRSSRYTANPPSRTSHASSKYDSDDNSSVAGPGSLRSQSRSGSGEFPVNDQATGTIGPEHSQKEAEIEKDSGEETETDGHRTPVPKKPCRGVVVPPLEMNLRSRGNGRR